VVSVPVSSFSLMFKHFLSLVAKCKARSPKVHHHLRWIFKPIYFNDVIMKSYFKFSVRLVKKTYWVVLEVFWIIDRGTGNRQWFKSLLWLTIHHTKFLAFCSLIANWNVGRAYTNKSPLNNQVVPVLLWILSVAILAPVGVLLFTVYGQGPDSWSRDIFQL